jgi:hypothetical protein
MNFSEVVREILCERAVSPPSVFEVNEEVLARAVSGPSTSAAPAV